MPDIYDIDEGRPEPFIGPPAPGDPIFFPRPSARPTPEPSPPPVQPEPYKPPDIFGTLGRFGRGLLQGDIAQSEIVQSQLRGLGIDTGSKRFKPEGLAGAIGELAGSPGRLLEPPPPEYYERPARLFGLGPTVPGPINLALDVGGLMTATGASENVARSVAGQEVRTAAKFAERTFEAPFLMFALGAAGDVGRTAGKATAKLPSELALAKPRYSYGTKQFTLDFEDDVTRAAYVTAQAKPSKRDADYLKFVMDATWLDEAGVRQLGRDIRADIKEQARTAESGVSLKVQRRMSPEPLASVDIAPPSPPGPPGGTTLAAFGGDARMALRQLGEFVTGAERARLTELDRAFVSEQRAVRKAAFDASLNKHLSQGQGFEEAVSFAKEELRGPFARATMPAVLANIFRKAAFARIDQVLGSTWEAVWAHDVLTKTLRGVPINDIPGRRGGSAKSILEKVFGEPKPHVAGELPPGAPHPPSVTGTPTFEVLSRIAGRKAVGSGGDAVEGVFEDMVTRLEKKWPPMQRPLYPVPELPAEQLPLQSATPSLPPRAPGPITPPEALSFWEEEALRRNYPNAQWPPVPKTEAPVVPGTPFEERLASQGKLNISAIGSQPVAPSSLQAGLPPGQATAAVVTPRSKDVTAQLTLIPQHVSALRNAARDALMTAVDIGNFIRANLSSADFSWWRQQAPMILNNKRDFLAANVAAWRAVWDPQFAAAAERRIQRSQYYRLYEGMVADGGTDFLRPLSYKGVPAWRREESFMVLGGERAIPRFAEKLPWIRWSQRAFVTGVNEMNWRMFARHVEHLYEINEKIGAGKVSARGWKGVQAHAKAYAGMIGDMTGRGQLGPLKELSPAMNAGFFSLRLTIGRILTPRHLVSADPFVRKEAFKNIVTFVGGIGGVMFAGEQLGLWHVETDPHSSNFMKIRVGPHRIDPWGGYIKYPVFLARLLTGTGVSGETGREYPARFWDTTGRFIEGMGSPLAGALMDVMEGKIFTGEKLDPTSTRQWVERFAPMTAQDIYNGLEEDGLSGLVTTVSAVGFGVNSYPYIVGELHGKWQREIDEYNAIPGVKAEADAKNLPSRTEYRRKHPETNAKLLITGYVDTVESPEALKAVIRIMKENRLSVSDISSLQMDEAESYEHSKLRNAIEKALGEDVTARPRPEDPTAAAKWDFEKALRDSGYEDVLAKNHLYKDPATARLYDEWHSLPSKGIGVEDLRRLLPQSPLNDPRIQERMRVIDDMVKSEKRRLRTANPALDAGLIRYGQSTEPLTGEGVRERLKQVQAMSGGGG